MNPKGFSMVFSPCFFLRVFFLRGFLHGFPEWGSQWASLGSSRNPKGCSMSWVFPAFPEWAEQLTQMGRGKHFIGDFLPPDELEKFMETFKALKVSISGIPGMLHTHPTAGNSSGAPCSRHSCREKRDPIPALSREMGQRLGRIPSLGGNSQRIRGCSIPGSILGLWEVSLPTGLDGLKGPFPLWNATIWDFAGIPNSHSAPLWDQWVPSWEKKGIFLLLIAGKCKPHAHNSSTFQSFPNPGIPGIPCFPARGLTFPGIQP